MKLPGWDTVAGVVAGLIWKAIDRRRQIDGSIHNIEQTIESLVGHPGTESRVANLQHELSKLRSERARLKSD